MMATLRCDHPDIEVFIEKLERLIKNNEIQEYHPDILTAKDILKVTKKY